MNRPLASAGDDSSSDPAHTHTYAHMYAHTEPSEAELLARFFRVLGDPTRLRLLQLLLEAQACRTSYGIVKQCDRGHTRHAAC